MSFDPFTARWTKFLHSEPACTSTRDAIDTLLRESERELVKLLSANGNAVPFQGFMVQTLTLHRGQRRAPSAGSSVESESVLVAAPGSTLSDTVPDEFVQGEHPTEVAATKEPLVDEAPVKRAVVEEEEKPISLCEMPEPLCVEPEPVSPNYDTISSDWRLWDISNKEKRKRKARFKFDEIHPVEEYPTEVPSKESPAETRVEEIWVEWNHPAEEVCSANDIIEDVPTCNPEPDAPPLEGDFLWGYCTTKDKKKGRKSIEKEMSTQPLEPEPTPQPAEYDDWGSFSAPEKEGKTLTKVGKSSPPRLEPVSDPIGEFEEPKQDEPSTKN
jgi:hypothetical protein